MSTLSSFPGCRPDRDDSDDRLRISDKRRETLVLVNVGSFCDGTLFACIVEELAREYDIVILTDANAIGGAFGERVLRERTRDVVVLDMPTDIIDDPAFPLADTSDPAGLFWIARHPLPMLRLLLWQTTLRNELTRQCRRHDAACIVSHYALVMLLVPTAPYPNARGETVPLAFTYFGPGFPNSRCPWLFDGNLRSRAFRLYAPESDAVVQSSWRGYWGRLDAAAHATGASPYFPADSARGGAFSKLFGRRAQTEPASSEVVRKMNDVHHLLCWNKHVTPELPSKLRNLRYVGAVVGARTPKHPKRQDAVRDAKARDSEVIVARAARETARWRARRVTSGENRGAGVAFLAFGSFGKHLSAENTRDIVRALVDAGYFCWLHGKCRIAEEDEESTRRGPNYTSPNFSALLRDAYYKLPDTYVAYDVVVPKTNIVVFTGSACLQTTCHALEKPMLFVPVLTEQFLWAKNYEHFTGVPYVDVFDEGAVYTQTLRALSGLRPHDSLFGDKKMGGAAARYFKQVSMSIRGDTSPTRPRSRLVVVVSDIIASAASSHKTQDRFLESPPSSSRISIHLGSSSARGVVIVAAAFTVAFLLTAIFAAIVFAPVWQS